MALIDYLNALNRLCSLRYLYATFCILEDIRINMQLFSYNLLLSSLSLLEVAAPYVIKTRDISSTRNRTQ